MKDKNSKKTVIIAASVVGALVLGIVGYLLFPKKNNNTVTAYPVEGLNEPYYGSDSYNSENITGNVLDEYSQEVRQRSDLTLRRIHVKRGQRVKKGAILVTYDCRRDELQMKLKEIEVVKREKDINARQNALQTLRNTGRDTYNDETVVPEDGDTGDDTDTGDDGVGNDTDDGTNDGTGDDIDDGDFGEDDASLPSVPNLFNALRQKAGSLTNPLHAIVSASSGDPINGDGNSGSGNDQGGSENTDSGQSGSGQSGSGNDQNGSGNDQSGSGNDQSGSGNDQGGSENTDSGQSGNGQSGSDNNQGGSDNNQGGSANNQSGSANNQSGSDNNQNDSGNNQNDSANNQSGSGSNTDKKSNENSSSKTGSTKIPKGITPTTKVEVLRGNRDKKSTSVIKKDRTTMMEVYIKGGANSKNISGQAILDALDIVKKKSLNITTIIFKRFTPDEVDAGSGDPVELYIESGNYFVPDITPENYYSIETLNTRKQFAREMTIKSTTNGATEKVVKGKSYTYYLDVDGDDCDTDIIEWSVSGNKSKKTKIDANGKLTVGSDETSKKLTIKANISGKTTNAHITVTKKSGNSNNGNSDDDDDDDDDDSNKSKNKKNNKNDKNNNNNNNNNDTTDNGSDIDNEDVVLKGQDLTERIMQREEELEDAKIELEEARIQFTELKQKVEAATVRASMNGRITTAYTKNNLPESGKPIVVLKSVRGTYIQFNVNEMNLSKVKPGGTIYYQTLDQDDTFEEDELDYSEEELDEFADEADVNSKKYKAIVTDVADYPTDNKPSNDYYDDYYGSGDNPDTSSYTVTASVDKAAGNRLQPGTALRISFTAESMGIETDEDNIYLMSPFIRQEGRRYYVYKVGKDNRLVKQYVKVGVTTYGYTQILDGLTLDDYIAFPYSKDDLDQARTKKDDNTEEIKEKLMESPEFNF